MNRRIFLGSAGVILAAPAIVRADSLMRVRRISPIGSVLDTLPPAEDGSHWQAAKPPAAISYIDSPMLLLALYADAQPRILRDEAYEVCGRTRLSDGSGEILLIKPRG